MKRSGLARIAGITAIIAAISFLIAGIIGAATGIFSSKSICLLPLGRPGHASKVTINDRKTLPVSGIGSISIEGVSEDITVRESPKNEITAWFHGSISSIPAGERPQLIMERHGSTVEIRIDRKQRAVSTWTSSDTALEVGIPKQYADKLSIRAISGNIRMESHDYGELALSTVSGDVETGDMKAERLEAETTSGNLRITLLNAPVNVDARTTSGDMSLSVKGAPQRVTMESISGNIDLGIPASSQFALSANSVSGEITCDFPIIIKNSCTGGGEHALEGTVGSNRNTINANSVSGDIRIGSGGMANRRPCAE